MRHFNILAACAATLMLGSVASAKDTPEEPKEKKICRFESDSTSRLGKRVCRTKAEWASESDRNRGDVGRPIPGSNRGR